MRDGPAQSRDGYFPIQAFEEAEQMINRRIIIPMHRQRHSALGRPFSDLIVSGFIGIAGPVIVVHSPGNPLSEPAKSQHVVAESSRQESRQTLQFLNFAAGRLAVQGIRHANGQLTLLPDFKRCLIVGRR
jgi:hypothetical protein